jgi:hypothetical protein
MTACRPIYGMDHGIPKFKPGRIRSNHSDCIARGCMRQGLNGESRDENTVISDDAQRNSTHTSLEDGRMLPRGEIPFKVISTDEAQPSQRGANLNCFRVRAGLNMNRVTFGALVQCMVDSLVRFRLRTRIPIVAGLCADPVLVAECIGTQAHCKNCTK